MVKNKEWCNIPDEFYNNFQANIGRTTKIADQACTMAEQAKKMQSQGGMGAAPPPIKLPAGPL
jgi:hypothetical protein